MFRESLDPAEYRPPWMSDSSNTTDATDATDTNDTNDANDNNDTVAEPQVCI